MRGDIKLSREEREEARRREGDSGAPRTHGRIPHLRSQINIHPYGDAAEGRRRGAGTQASWSAAASDHCFYLLVLMFYPARVSSKLEYESDNVLGRRYPPRRPQPGGVYVYVYIYLPEQLVAGLLSCTQSLMLQARGECPH